MEEDERQLKIRELDLKDRELKQKKEELSRKDRDHLWDLGKVFLGTVVVGVFGTLINAEIQRKKVEVEELEQLGQFIDHALNEDLTIRRQFAQYFATVTTSDDLRERWAEYSENINDEWLRFRAAQDSLLAELRDSTETSRARVAELEARIDSLNPTVQQPINVTTGRFNAEETAACVSSRAALVVRLVRIALSCSTGVFLSAEPVSVERLGELGIRGVTAVEELPVLDSGSFWRLPFTLRRADFDLR